MPNNPTKDKTQIINASCLRVLPQGWAFIVEILEIIHRVINTKQENEQHNFQTLAQITILVYLDMAD